MDKCVNTDDGILLTEVEDVLEARADYFKDFATPAPKDDEYDAEIEKHLAVINNMAKQSTNLP